MRFLFASLVALLTALPPAYALAAARPPAPQAMARGAIEPARSRLSDSERQERRSGASRERNRHDSFGYYDRRDRANDLARFRHSRGLTERYRGR